MRNFNLIIIAVVLFLCGCSDWHESPDAGICQFTKDSIKHERYTFTEYAKYSDIENMYGGSEFEDWKIFNSIYQKGDCLLYFTTDESSWKGLSGEKGIAIIRNGKVLYMFAYLVS